MSDATKIVLAAVAALVVVAGCVFVVRAFDSPTSVMILALVGLAGGALSVYFSGKGGRSKEP